LFKTKYIINAIVGDEMMKKKKDEEEEGGRRRFYTGPQQIGIGSKIYF
jgi:hypothetical protein